jgi:hypothetical protein
MLQRSLPMQRSLIESLRDSIEVSRRRSPVGGDRRRRHWGWGFGLILVAAPLALAVPAGAILVIDDFGSDQSLTLLAVDSAVANVAAADGVAIGGERDLQIERVSGTGGAELGVNGGTPPQGQLLFSADPETATLMRIVWDGADGIGDAVAPDGLGSVDLSSAGAFDGFVVDVDVDLGTTLSLRVYDASDGSGQTWSQATVPLLPTGGQFVLVEVPFAAFSESGPSGAAAFTNVGAISLEVAGGSALDLRLDSVHVPEPGAAPLAALAGLALLARNRRRGGR